MNIAPPPIIEFATPLLAVVVAIADQVSTYDAIIEKEL
jgi:hypothetical protein